VAAPDLSISPGEFLRPGRRKRHWLADFTANACPLLADSVGHQCSGDAFFRRDKKVRIQGVIERGSNGELVLAMERIDARLLGRRVPTIGAS
jgi:hypothetical protein